MSSYRSHGAYQNEWRLRAPSSERSESYQTYLSSPRLERSNPHHYYERRRSRSPTGRCNSAMLALESYPVPNYETHSESRTYSNNHPSGNAPVWIQVPSWRNCEPEASGRRVDQATYSNNDHQGNVVAHPGRHPQGEPSDRTMPKNFPQPLTCFYWHTQGRCNKSDEECWYAHCDTGVYASAPIRTGAGGKLVLSSHRYKH